MKFLKVVSLGALLLPALIATAQEQPAAPAAQPAPAGEATLKGNDLKSRMETLDSETNRVSYAIGINVARNIIHNYPDVNLDFFNLAVYDIFKGGNRSKLTEDQLNTAIARYSEVANLRAQQQANDLKTYNLEAAEKFLAQNSNNEGVVTLPSGLQYKVITKGSDVKVPADGVARVHLHGTLLNGLVFKSTLIEKSDAVEIRVAQAVPGLREALPMMTVGAKWEIFIHPKLGYGENGDLKVGPNDLLLMSIEVLGAY